jgi:hypothetical protein
MLDFVVAKTIDELVQPTPIQCRDHEVVFENETQIGFADYHPQWGGYCGRCIVIFTKGQNSPCFDVYNWHDGEFPTDEDDHYTLYHYCDVDQMINFGKTIKHKFTELGTSP